MLSAVAPFRPREIMRYSANKTLLILAVIMGGSTSVAFLWASLPTESMSATLALLANALGFWFVISAMTFVMFWMFYKLIISVGRNIHDRFYRAPTL